MKSRIPLEIYAWEKSHCDIVAYPLIHSDMCPNIHPYSYSSRVVRNWYPLVYVPASEKAHTMVLSLHLVL